MPPLFHFIQKQTAQKRRFPNHRPATRIARKNKTDCRRQTGVNAKHRKIPAPCFWFFIFCFLFSSVALTAETAPATPPIRIVSQTVGTDELLLAVAAPGQIAALSHLARDTTYSGIANEAESFPQIAGNGDAETVLAHKPTLVLFTDYSREELVEQVRRAGVKVLVFDRYATLEDCYENLRTLARAIDPAAEKRAEKIIADCRTRVAALKEKLKNAKPVPVIAPSTYGLIAGSATTFQDMCDNAGAENLAATRGGLRGHVATPSEKVLAWPAEKIVLQTEPAAGGVSGKNIQQARAAVTPFLKISPFRFMPAVRECRVALVTSPQFSCTSHLRVAGYEQLARELHPEIFAPGTPARP